MGRPSWTTRLTVEECRVLRVEWMQRDGVFRSGAGSTWTCLWRDDTGFIEAAIGYVVVRERDELALMIDPDQAKQYLGMRILGRYAIPITSTRPHFGGMRFWFRCPVMRDGIPCGRRVGRLYLPPDTKIFGCRGRLNLTYRSTQTHDPRTYKLAQDLGAIDAAFHSGDLRRGLLASRALRLQRKWAREGRWSRLASIYG
jgi:hypothetical protein